MQSVAARSFVNQQYKFVNIYRDAYLSIWTVICSLPHLGIGSGDLLRV